MRQGRAGNPQLGAFLRSLRHSREWTLARAAAEANVHPTALSRFESGVRLPSLEQLSWLAKTYDVGLSELLQRLGRPSLPGFEELLKEPNVETALAAVVAMASTSQKRRLLALWLALEFANSYVVASG